MKNTLEKGSTAEGILMLVALSIIIFLFLIPGRRLGPMYSIVNLGGGSTGDSSQGGSSLTSPTSSYSRSVSLGSGDASYAIQPSEEYVTINNNGSQTINITGWSLRNNKENRAYAVGNSLRKYTSDEVTIPTAAKFVSPTGSNILNTVSLAPQESAIITTGKIATRSPYPIVSFKENICSGYLEDLSGYDFNPPLQNNCPDPDREIGAGNLDIPCQKYLQNMSSCHTPKFDTVDTQGHTTDSRGNVCTGCVDGTAGLSSSCVAFIRSHFNYAGCIAYHAADPDFSLRQWRIFLGEQWELWASDHENIQLFDSSHKLVNSYSY